MKFCSKKPENKKNLDKIQRKKNKETISFKEESEKEERKNKL